MTTAFDRFPEETLAFLRDLEAHNDRDWFEANRDRYEAAWRAPARAFVDAVREPLAGFLPPVTADPGAHGSLFRIFRDTRFSNDKTPYKPWIAVKCWLGDDKKRNVVLYGRIRPDEILLGAGLYGFDKDVRDRWRARVASADGERLAALLEDLAADGWQPFGDRLKRTPKPWTDDHPRADLLKHKGFGVSRVIGEGDVATAPGFVDRVVDAWEGLMPVASWLQGLVDDA